MLILKMIRYIFGFVHFNACGGFPERFLNLCRIRGITLWDIRCENGMLSAFADRSSYKKMRSIAKSSGMKMRMDDKFGLTFFLDRNSRRIGILAGAAIMCALISILSTRLWCIKVEGNERISSEEIISAFEGAGIRPGMPAADIDPTETELEVQKNLKGISWVNINIRGCSAMIEVREAAETERKSFENSPSDIVASSDGIIRIFRSFNGTAEEKTGSPVLKGDLLISGIKQNRDLTFSFCKAEGYVVAETNKKISSAKKRSLVVSKITNTKTVYTINFFGLKIPLGRLTGSNVSIDKTRLKINGIILPAGVTRKRLTVESPCGIVLTENECRLLTLSELFRECGHSLKYVKAENTAFEIRSDDKGCSAVCKAVCLENIAKETPLQVEDQPLPAR